MRVEHGDAETRTSRNVTSTGANAVTQPCRRAHAASQNPHHNTASPK
jgi:hypothetical protein